MVNRIDFEGAPSPDEQRVQQLGSDLQQAGNNHHKIERAINGFINDIAATHHSVDIDKIIHRLGAHGIEEKRIQDVCKGILQFQRPVPPNEDPIPLQFLCDVDCADHNGAIVQRLVDGIKSQVPVITSRALFQRQNQGEGLNYFSNEVVGKLAETYEIYAKGAYLILLPKTIGSPEKLDLDPNVLKKITLEEAFRITNDKPTIEEFQELFVESPAHPKLVYIAGHGGVGSPAGFTPEHYRKFLEWAEKQHCQGLLITSCYSGGASVMHHLPQQNDQQNTPGTSFPVFVRSIGDLVTKGGQEPEMHIDRFFSKLTELLKSPGGHTIFRLRKAVQELENKEEKEPVNLLQVYFPASRDSPGGFRPVGEGGKSSDLTYVRYRRQQIEEGSVTVKNKDFIEVAPVMVECPLVIESKSPVLLSTVPGKACHLLTTVTLDAVSPQDFLRTNAAFYKKEKPGVKKTFLISHLHSPEKDLYQVCANITSGIYCYREGDLYYLWDAGKEEAPIPISPFQYLLRWRDVVTNSSPDPEAVRRVTGGQQNPQALMHNLADATFWQDQQGVFNKFKELFVEKELTAETLLSQVEKWKLTDAEVVSLITYLIPDNEELACSLFTRRGLSPDSKNENGCPLIVSAAASNCLSLTQLLIASGADVNIMTQNNSTNALASVLRSDNAPMVDLLLEQPSIDLALKNQRGNPAFVTAAFREENLRKCLMKKTDLNLNIVCTLEQGKKSLLAMAVQFFSKQSVELLLQSGADPNYMGEGYSPLCQALIEGDREKIDLLLQYGANPFLRDADNHYPILEAINRSPVELFTTMLTTFNEKTASMDPLEKQDLVGKMFFEALVSGDAVKIRMILYMNPDLIPWKPYSYQKGVERLALYGRGDLIQEIVNRYRAVFVDVEKDAVLIFLNKSPEGLIEIMDNTWNLGEIMEMVIKHETLTPEMRERILLKAVELGVDLNQPVGMWNENLLKIAIEKNNEPVIRLLIENGANMVPVSKELLAMPNVSLIKFAFEKGLPVNASTSDEESALQQIVTYGNLTMPETQEIFKWLVTEKKADLNAVHLTKPPLHGIVRKGNKELYTFCLANNVTLQDPSLLVSLAVKSRSPDAEWMVRDLVTRGADLNGVGEGDECTAFSAIVDYGSLDLITWCLDRGALINPDNPKLKLLPLQAAGRNKNPRPVLELLLSRGGNINQRGSDFNPLINFIATGNLELVVYYFDQGGALNDSRLVERAFELALGKDNPSFVTELINRGYQFSMADMDENRAKWLLSGAYHNGLKMLEKALEFSPPVTAIAKAAEDITLSIIKNNDAAALELLEKHGVLLLANERQMSNIIYRLSLESGYEVAFAFMNRLRPEQQLEILKDKMNDFLEQKDGQWLKFALDKGVDPNMKINDFWSLGENIPLIVKAIATKNPHIVEIILSKHPDLSVTHKNQSLLGFAKAQDNEEIVKLIEQAISKS